MGSSYTASRSTSPSQELLSLNLEGVGLAEIADPKNLHGVVRRFRIVLSRPPRLSSGHPHLSCVLSTNFSGCLYSSTSMMQKDFFFVERNLLERSLPPHDALRDAAIGDL